MNIFSNGRPALDTILLSSVYRGMSRVHRANACKGCWETTDSKLLPTDEV